MCWPTVGVGDAYKRLVAHLLKVVLLTDLLTNLRGKRTPCGENPRLHRVLVVFFDVVAAHGKGSDTYTADSVMVPNDPVAPAALGPADDSVRRTEINQNCDPPRHPNGHERPCQQDQHDDEQMVFHEEWMPCRGLTVELSCGPTTPVRTNNRHCIGLTASAVQAGGPSAAASG